MCLPGVVQQRIELIQDFTMPTASTCIALSRTCEYIYVAGEWVGIKCHVLPALWKRFDHKASASRGKAGLSMGGWWIVLSPLLVLAVVSVASCCRRVGNTFSPVGSIIHTVAYTRVPAGMQGHTSHAFDASSRTSSR